MRATACDPSGVGPGVPSALGQLALPGSQSMALRGAVERQHSACSAAGAHWLPNPLSPAGRSGASPSAVGGCFELAPSRSFASAWAPGRPGRRSLGSAGCGRLSVDWGGGGAQAEEVCRWEHPPERSGLCCVEACLWAADGLQTPTTPETTNFGASGCASPPARPSPRRPHQAHAYRRGRYPPLARAGPGSRGCQALRPDIAVRQYQSCPAEGWTATVGTVCPSPGEPPPSRQYSVSFMATPPPPLLFDSWWMGCSGRFNVRASCTTDFSRTPFVGYPGPPCAVSGHCAPSCLRCRTIHRFDRWSFPFLCPAPAPGLPCVPSENSYRGHRAARAKGYDPVQRGTSCARAIAP